MKRRGRAVRRAPGSLSVQCNDVAISTNQPADPFPEARFKYRRIKNAEDVPEGVMRRGAVRQGQKGLEPGFFVFAPVRHRHPVVGSAQNGTDGHDDYFAQAVPLGRSAARVFQSGEDCQQARLHPRKIRE